MVIEWLKFRVQPDLRETYIQQDELVWTAALAKYPGFLGKQVWISPTETDTVIFVIQWADRESWKSIPAKDLALIEQRFLAQVGEGTYALIETGEYQVRKFAQPSES